MIRATIKAQKRALRQAMIEGILAMDPADRRAQEAELAETAPSLPGFAEAQTVLLYVAAFAEEIGTAPILREALRLGKRLVCPKVDPPARRLLLYQIEHLGADFAPGVLGIPEPLPSRPTVEPETIDWVLVPGLAFDERGYRLGRGGGYYDRFLPRLRPSALRWAIALESQCLSQIPIEPHDQQLDGILSPSKMIRCVRERTPGL